MDDLIEKEMKTAVKNVRDQLQVQLDNHYSSGYNACDATLTSNQDKTGPLEQKKSLFTEAQSQHKMCRAKEAGGHS